MATPPTLESPLPTLRLSLEGSRRAGISFVDAWEPAVKSALRSVGAYPGGFGWQDWRVALDETWKAWRDAYERRGSGREVASLLELAEQLDSDALYEPPHSGLRRHARLVA